MDSINCCMLEVWSMLTNCGKFVIITAGGYPMHYAYTVYSGKAMNGSFRGASRNRQFSACVAVLRRQALIAEDLYRMIQHISLQAMCHLCCRNTTQISYKGTISFVSPTTFHYRKENRSHGFN